MANRRTLTPAVLNMGRAWSNNASPAEISSCNNIKTSHLRSVHNRVDRSFKSNVGLDVGGGKTVRSVRDRLCPLSGAGRSDRNLLRCAAKATLRRKLSPQVTQYRRR